MFAIEGTTEKARAREIARAKRACAACPVVADCLKWALANPDLTRVGVWAATTPRDRAALRRRLVDRLGEDWVGVVSARDQAARQRTPTPGRLRPPVRDLVLLAGEAVPVRPLPRTPPAQVPLTPAQQEHNRQMLVLAVTGKTA
ncbi:hypothetical protein GCM10027168_44660 [Streptomyces capparidis]